MTTALLHARPGPEATGGGPPRAPDRAFLRQSRRQALRACIALMCTLAKWATSTAGPADDGAVQLSFTADQTQISLSMQLPPNATYSTDAYAEFDPLGGSISGPTEDIVGTAPRLRQAYWRFRWNGGGDAIMVGQADALFGDLDAGQTLDSLPLALGAVFGREPQVRYTHVARFDAATQLTYAVSLNAPNAGLFDESMGATHVTHVPFVHAKIGYQSDRSPRPGSSAAEGRSAVPAQLSVSGFIGRRRTPTMFGAGTDVTAWGAALGGVLPIARGHGSEAVPSAVLRAQAWLGQQLDGYFGGNGQGVYETAAGHVGGIRAHGGFVEASWILSPTVNVSAGYSIDRNDLDKLVRHGVTFVIDSGLFGGGTPGAPGLNQGRNANTALWYQPFKRAFVGLVWDYRMVNYNSGALGASNRVSVWMSGKF